MSATVTALVLALLPFVPPSIHDLDGRVQRPFAPPRAAAVLLFLATDCPISNAYAPEIQRVCRTYASRGVDCLVLYEDAQVEAAAARKHRMAYGFGDIPAAVDARRTIATVARATITPEAVVIDRTGGVAYRGRIDDVYVDLGRRRAAPTTHDLRDAIEAVIAGKPVPRSSAPALGCYIAPPWKATKRVKEPS